MGGEVNQAKEISIVPISKIIPNHKNRNKHSAEQIERLKQIITYQGFRVPVIVSNRSGKLVAGHGRLLAAKELGLKDVPVIYQDFESDEQEYAAGISDNSVALWAELDLAGINTDLPDLGPDFDLDMLGIKDFVLDMSEKDGDDDAVPEPPKIAKTKRGELWRLGEHRLMCGDATNLDDVRCLMNGEKADMVFTDPPYGINYQSNYRKEKFDKLANDDIVMSEWVEPALQATIGWFIFFCAWQRLDEWMALGRKAGKLTNLLIWRKAAAMGDLTGQFSPTFEVALAYSRGAKLREGNRPSAVFEKNIEGASEFSHPTQKPVSLVVDILTALPTGTVFDPFLGSGSTLIACEKTNRKCYGMEISPEYCDVIIKRFQTYSGKKAIREDGVEWDSL